MTCFLKKLYHQQSFNPGFIGIFVTPFYFARRNLHAAIEEFAPNLSGSLLDVGCGSKPYKTLMNVISYRGLDLSTEVSIARGVADDLYDGGTFPYDDCTFDSVLCNQVLEHVFNPHEFIAEINRVLKPGGKIVLTLPFVWDEHEQPYDYARYSSFGLRAILEKSGFKIIAHKKLGADASTLFQLTNSYLYKITLRWPKAAKLFFTATVIASVNIFGLFAERILPRNQDLFLDHAVLAEKVL